VKVTRSFSKKILSRKKRKSGQILFHAEWSDITEYRRFSKQSIISHQSKIIQIYPEGSRMTMIFIGLKSMTSFFGSILKTIVMPEIRKQYQI